LGKKEHNHLFLGNRGYYFFGVELIGGSKRYLHCLVKETLTTNFMEQWILLHREPGRKSEILEASRKQLLPYWEAPTFT